MNSKSKGQSYEQMIEALKGYADAGDYGCYITTLPDDRVLEEYNAKHPDTPIDMEAFKRGETAIAGKDTEYNAPNTALVGETLTLTADSTDGKATDFKIGGAFTMMIMIILFQKELADARTFKLCRISSLSAKRVWND